MQEPEIAVKKVVWKDFETGEIYEDSADISYYKCQLLTQKYDELTLGDFNCDGNYVIAREILEELVNANKYITDYENGTYHLVAKAPSLVYELKFLLKIAKKEDKMVATLSLCEVLSTGLELTTDIARYKDDDNIYFLQKVAKVFHIVEKKDSTGREEENENILQSTISLIKKFVANKQAHIAFVNNESKEYVEKIIEKLKTKTDKFSKYVLKEYSRIVEDNKKHLEKPNYYTKVRKALDKVINSSIKQCEDEDIKKTIKEQRKTFAEKVGANEIALNTTASAAIKPAAKQENKPAKKEESKGGKPEKGKGPTKANSGNNKDKGKDDKKKSPASDDKKEEKSKEKEMINSALSSSVSGQKTEDQNLEDDGIVFYNPGDNVVLDPEIVVDKNAEVANEGNPTVVYSAAELPNEPIVYDEPLNGKLKNGKTNRAPELPKVKEEELIMN